MERAINYYSSSFFCHQGRKERYNSTESLDVGYGKCPEFVCVDGLIVSKEQADWREEDTEQSMISTQGTLTTLRYSTLTTLRYSTLTTLRYSTLSLPSGTAPSPPSGTAPSPLSCTGHPHHTQVHGTLTTLRYRAPKPHSGTGYPHHPQVQGILTTLRYSTLTTLRYRTLTTSSRGTLATLRYSTLTTLRYSTLTTLRYSTLTTLRYNTLTTLRHSTLAALRYSPHTLRFSIRSPLSGTAPTVHIRSCTGHVLDFKKSTHIQHGLFMHFLTSVLV